MTAVKTSRQDKTLAVIGSLGLAGCSIPLYFTIRSLESLPPLTEVLSLISSAALSLSLLLGLAKIAFFDKLHFEWHKGKLTLQWGLLPSIYGKALNKGDVVVQPTADRGNGAFATVPIAKGTKIGEFEGDVMSGEEFDRKYPRGTPSDFATCIDEDCCIDAAHLVSLVDDFKMVHMNHSRSRANVDRIKLRREKKVMFAARRDIEEGEELLYDYGSAYWQGREQEELP